MPTVDTAPASPPKPSSGLGFAEIVVAVASAFAWWLALRMVSMEWETNPQYRYGITVPLLCLALFYLRWGDRPSPHPPETAARRVTFGLAGLCALVFGAVQPLFEANPEWRLLGWIAVPAVLLLTLGAIYIVGGWGWVWHFAFPVLFILVAVPWPRGPEKALMTALMGKAAAVTLEVLRWGGYLAIQRGNLIELPTGVLGIEEACSGVRSLQSALMAGFFFGEFLRMTWPRRLVLLVIAVCSALVGNVVRTSILAIAVSREGMEKAHALHDPAGFGILFATILVVGAAAFILRPRTHRADGQGAERRTVARASIPALIAPLLGMCAFWAACLLGTEAWFQAHERNLPRMSGWSIQPGLADKSAVQPEGVEKYLADLRANSGTSERWKGAGGLLWQYFYFRWEPGRNAANAIQVHDPTVCLRSIGMTLDAPLGEHPVDVRGTVIPFRAFRFNDRGKPVFVFHTVIEDYARTDAGTRWAEGVTRQSRIAATLAGKRNRGQRMLEVAVWGTDDLRVAEVGLRGFLERSLVPSAK